MKKVFMSMAVVAAMFAVAACGNNNAKSAEELQAEADSIAQAQADSIKAAAEADSLAQLQAVADSLAAAAEEAAK